MVLHVVSTEQAHPGVDCAGLGGGTSVSISFARSRSIEVVNAGGEQLGTIRSNGRGEGSERLGTGLQVSWSDHADRRTDTHIVSTLFALPQHNPLTVRRCWLPKAGRAQQMTSDDSSCFTPRTAAAPARQKVHNSYQGIDLIVRRRACKGSMEIEGNVTLENPRRDPRHLVRSVLEMTDLTRLTFSVDSTKNLFVECFLASLEPFHASERCDGLVCNKSSTVAANRMKSVTSPVGP